MGKDPLIKSQKPQFHLPIYLLLLSFNLLFRNLARVFI
jgi:hypothetical protein